MIEYENLYKSNIRFFSDYKKTDFGIVVPYTKNVDMGSFSMPSTITKLEINKELDPSTFEMPK